MGYGVQSPNDFHFVQHVLREKLPYYAYSTLKEFSRDLSRYHPSNPVAIDQLLFRLANHVHPTLMIEVGAGTSALALSLACPTARCVAITEDDALNSSIWEHATRDLQIEVKTGDEMAIFLQLLHDHQEIGMLHIAHTSRYREILEAALPHVTDDTLIVIEGIRESKEKVVWWESLLESPSTVICYDLGNVGLLFFDRSRHKNTYWINLKKRV